MIKSIVFDIGGVILDAKELIKDLKVWFKPKDEMKFWEELNLKIAPLCKGSGSLYETMKEFAKEKKVKILNICADGLAFENMGFRQFDHDAIKFTLDIPNFKGDSTFSVGLKILTIDKNNICHSIFEQCSLEQHELIHKYVLELQKDDLAH